MIKYKAGYKYQTVENHTTFTSINQTESIRVSDFLEMLHGMLTIKTGYAWDGPSGPTIDTKTFMRGSLIHDALYQLIREGLLPTSFRKAADLELYRACREDGMNWVRANYVYRAVRIFGGKSASKSRKKPILEAGK